MLNRDKRFNLIVGILSFLAYSTLDGDSLVVPTACCGMVVLVTVEKLRRETKRQNKTVKQIVSKYL